MTVSTDPTLPGTDQSHGCTGNSRLTGALLGYGILAGPVYVVTSLAQAATRTGFDLSRHSWSQLALGGMGWVQTVNLLATGLMVVAGAVGIGRALTGRAGTGGGGLAAASWGSGLIAVFGLSMMAAAVFRVDPSGGFPVGVPETTSLGTSALLHLVAGAIGFIALTAGLLLVARPRQAAGSRRPAMLCRVVAPVFLGVFLVMASGVAGRSGIVVFTVGVVAVSGTLSLICWDRLHAGMAGA